MDEDLIKKMANLLLSRAKMLEIHCPTCKIPLFEKDGNVFCPSCNYVFNREMKMEKVEETKQEEKVLSLEGLDVLTIKERELLERLKKERNLRRILMILKALKMIKDLKG